MRRFFLVAPALALLGCDPPAPAPAVSSASSLSPAPSASSVSAAPAAVLLDLDVASLQKTLKCGGDATSGACGVLTKFASCTEWNPISPSGDGRWLGRGWAVEGAKVTEQFALVRSRRVPTSEVAAGQIGVKIAITDLPKQESSAFEHADRAIRAFERNDVPPRSSPTLEYVKQRTDWPEAFAMRTSGKHVYAIAANGTYYCQGQNRTLLVVQRAATRGSNGDGLYAELWPTSW
jgi:hypothetical protein